MFQFLKRRFRRNSLTPRILRRTNRERRPQLELLESRCVPDSGTWTAVAAPPASLGTMLLLPNGNVLAVADGITNVWYELTPDAQGNYATGTWTQVASMSVQRQYFTSDVLPSGEVLVLGGEFSSQGNDTNTGEIYNPATNKWSPVASVPQSEFGDEPSAMLPNGTVLAGYLVGPQTYIYNPATNSWSQTGTKLNYDLSSEEGWLELPGGDIFAYNDYASATSGVSSGQYYNPVTGAWNATGTFPTLLSSTAIHYEEGPGFLMPQNGQVIFLGGNSNTAIYNPSTNSWTAGPVIPNQMACDDAPGAVLPTGQIMFVADSGTKGSMSLHNHPSALFLYDPASNTMSSVTTVPSQLQHWLTNSAAAVDRMLVLPDGQLLLNVYGAGPYVYTPGGTIPSSWRPTITGITGSGLGPYTLTGTQLNGLDEGAAYGDDAQMNENYPIVQLTGLTGQVYYATTSHWSSERVRTGQTPVSTNFTLPANLPSGTYTLRVIADGIASSGTTFVYVKVPGASPLNPSAVVQPLTVIATLTGSGVGTSARAVSLDNGVPAIDSSADEASLTVSSPALPGPPDAAGSAHFRASHKLPAENLLLAVDTLFSLVLRSPEWLQGNL